MFFHLCCGSRSKPPPKASNPDERTLLLAHTIPVEITQPDQSEELTSRMQEAVQSTRRKMVDLNERSPFDFLHPNTTYPHLATRSVSTSTTASTDSSASSSRKVSPRSSHSEIRPSTLGPTGPRKARRPSGLDVQLVKEVAHFRASHGKDKASSPKANPDMDGPATIKNVPPILVDW